MAIRGRWCIEAGRPRSDHSPPAGQDLLVSGGRVQELGLTLPLADGRVNPSVGLAVRLADRI